MITTSDYKPLMLFIIFCSVVNLAKAMSLTEEISMKEGIVQELSACVSKSFLMKNMNLLCQDYFENCAPTGFCLGLTGAYINARLHGDNYYRQFLDNMIYFMSLSNDKMTELDKVQKQYQQFMVEKANIGFEGNPALRLLEMHRPQLLQEFNNLNHTVEGDAEFLLWSKGICSMQYNQEYEFDDDLIPLGVIRKNFATTYFGLLYLFQGLSVMPSIHYSVRIRSHVFAVSKKQDGITVFDLEAPQLIQHFSYSYEQIPYNSFCQVNDSGGYCAFSITIFKSPNTTESEMIYINELLTSLATVVNLAFSAPFNEHLDSHLSLLQQAIINGMYDMHTTFQLETLGYLVRRNENGIFRFEISEEVDDTEYEASFPYFLSQINDGLYKHNTGLISSLMSSLSNLSFNVIVTLLTHQVFVYLYEKLAHHSEEIETGL